MPEERSGNQHEYLRHCLRRRPRGLNRRRDPIIETGDDNDDVNAGSNALFHLHPPMLRIPLLSFRQALSLL